MGDTTVKQAAGVAAVTTPATSGKPGPAPADKAAPPANDRVELKPAKATKQPDPPAKTTLWQNVKDFFRFTAEWSWLLG